MNRKTLTQKKKQKQQSGTFISRFFIVSLVRSRKRRSVGLSTSRAGSSRTWKMLIKKTKLEVNNVRQAVQEKKKKNKKTHFKR